MPWQEIWPVAWLSKSITFTSASVSFFEAGNPHRSRGQMKPLGARYWCAIYREREKTERRK
eukprot:5513817-Prymnesium_polylepis.1